MLAEPDFLAVCFPEKAVWMVEVTRGRASFDSKIAEFNREYEPRIRDQLITDQVIRNEDASDWKIGFWAFVPQWDCERVQRHFEQAKVSNFRVDALEKALSLEAWDHRLSKR